MPRTYPRRVGEKHDRRGRWRKQPAVTWKGGSDFVEGEGIIHDLRSDRNATQASSLEGSSIIVQYVKTLNMNLE